MAETMGRHGKKLAVPGHQRPGPVQSSCSASTASMGTQARVISCRRKSWPVFSSGPGPGLPAGGVILACRAAQAPSIFGSRWSACGPGKTPPGEVREAAAGPRASGPVTAARLPKFLAGPDAVAEGPPRGLVDVVLNAFVTGSVWPGLPRPGPRLEPAGTLALPTRKSRDRGRPNLAAGARQATLAQIVPVDSEHSAIGAVPARAAGAKRGWPLPGAWDRERRPPLPRPWQGRLEQRPPLATQALAHQNWDMWAGGRRSTRRANKKKLCQQGPGLIEAPTCCSASGFDRIEVV